MAKKRVKHSATATYAGAPAIAAQAPTDRATCHDPQDTAQDHAQPDSLHCRAKFFISSGEEDAKYIQLYLTVY